MNLHGKTMDGFATTIGDFLVGLGVNPAHFFAGGHLSTTPSILPSYFRPSKNWDLIVLANSRFHPAKGDAVGPVLYAAVEFKSQEDSIGKNQNNRLEESDRVASCCARFMVGRGRPQEVEKRRTTLPTSGSIMLELVRIEFRCTQVF